jgi:hypothetical protein
VLQRLIAGRRAEAIASAERLSLATIRSHIRGVLTKLGVSSQLAAVAIGREAGVEPDAGPGRNNESAVGQREDGGGPAVG